MDATLAVPELLESILLQLDTRTLLTSAQRTNKTWHSLIQTSPSLQKALFLQPEYSIPPSISSSSSPQAPVFNDLLVETFPFCFQQLRQSQDSGSDLKPISRSRDTSTLDATSFPASKHITSRSGAFARRDASWRKMLIQQPPLRSYGVVMTACVPPSPSRNTRQQDGNEGAEGGAGHHDEAAEDGQTMQGVASTAQAAAAGVQEILLMPGPTLRSTHGGAQESHSSNSNDNEETLVTMPFLLDRCLTAPQLPKRDDQDVSISGFRVFWDDTAIADSTGSTYPGASGNELHASPRKPSRFEATAAATFPGQRGEQVRSAVIHQAQQHNMVLNSVVGLMKLGPVDAELRRVREILVDGGHDETRFGQDAQRKVKEAEVRKFQCEGSV